MTSESGDLAILKTSSLTIALERELERLIVSGELAPGERLNEFHLAARFGTSRGPLREATRSLEAKGFLQVVRNRGVFVRELTVEEVSEIYDVRGGLFALAGRLAAESMTDKTLVRLNALVEKMQLASDAQDFDAYYPLNLEFHAAILETAGNRTLQLEYHRFVKKMHLFRSKSLLEGGGLEVSNREHREIVRTLEARDPDAAFLTHWRHVERARQRLVSLIKAKDEDPHLYLSGSEPKARASETR